MKKIYLSTLSILSIAIFTSCNFAPEPYDNAMEMIETGKYENAVELLNRVTIDDKEWYDSALLRKNDAFELLVKNNDWERTMIFVENEGEDKMYKKEMKQIIMNYARELVKADKLDSLMNVVDANKKMLTELFEAEYVAKMADLVAKKVFVGNWIVTSKNMKGNEIYFDNDGELYLGKSSKSISGWNKDKIIYKVSEYKDGMTWKCSPRVFSPETYFSYAKEYFSGKGTVTIFSVDSILVDYKVTSSPHVTFVRQK